MSSIDKHFFCIRCREPCFTSVFSEEVLKRIDLDKEILLFCDDCYGEVTLSEDVFNSKTTFEIH